MWHFERDPLAALREGDPEPFEELVRTAAPALLGFFQRLGADPAEAEDMTQETFVRLHQGAARYTAEERLPAFCFRVARNVWIDQRRRRAARPAPLSLDVPAERSGALLDPAEAAAGPAELAGRADEAERVRRALARLPEPHRLAFELGVVQELPYAEVARLLDVPVGTVKSRVFHAVRRLREALGGPSGEDAP